MHSLDTDGTSLYYEQNGSGPPIVFTHGIPTDYRAWSSQVVELSRSYQTIAYSRRYAYPNQRQGDVTDSTVENNAADLKGMIEKLGLEPIHLVGHSYGGFIAAMFAAEHPEMVRSLVLVEPAISTLLVEDADNQGQLLGLLFRSPSVALSARRFQSNSLRPSLKALDAGQTEKAVELSVDGVQDMKGAFASMPDSIKKMMLENARTIAELRTRFPTFRERASRIACKTLVVNGAQSALWLRRIGELTAASIKQAQSAKVEGARHFPHMENATAFNQLVTSFVRS